MGVTLLSLPPLGGKARMGVIFRSLSLEGRGFG